MNRRKLTSPRITLILILSVLFVSAISVLVAGPPTTASARVGNLVSSVGKRAVELFSAGRSKVERTNLSSARAAIAPSPASPGLVTNDLRVVSQTVPNGTSSVTMLVEFDAAGNENAIGFSFHFNPTHLNLTAVTLVTVNLDPLGVPLTTILNTNPDPAVPAPPSGHVGINIGLTPFSSTLTAGTHRLLRLTFDILPAAQCGVVTPISIADGPPTVLSLAGSGGNPLPDPNPVSGNLTVEGPVITITPPTLSGGTINVPYSQQISASGGAGGFTFTLIGGTLPAGITLSGAGLLAGTTTQAGIFPGLMVRATDSSGCSAVQTYSLTILCPGTITLSPPTLPGGVVGTAYSASVSASPPATYTFAVTSGSLPPGLTLNAATGAITGTPTTAFGSPFNFTVTATTAGACTGGQSYSIAVVCPAISLNPVAGALPAATANSAYNQQFTATGGIGPHTFAVTAGALPSPLVLSSSGLLTGAPTTPADYSFTVTATDAGGSCTGSAIYSLRVNCPTLSITPGTLPSGTINILFSQQLTGNGGTGPYTFELISGSLPTGVSLSSAGLLSGTPTATGVFPNLQVRVTDANQCTGTQLFSLTIQCPVAITLSPATLPNALLGVAYTGTVSALPAGTYTFAVTSGVLPTGLVLDSGTGQITGTVNTAVGSPFNFTITATGPGPCVGSQAYAITVICPAITLSPPAGALTAGTANTPFSRQITASGGTGTYTFAVTAGALPSPLTISAGGLISGTPTTPGPYSFTVTATDTGTGCTGSAAYTLQVNCPVLTMTPLTGALPAATANVAYSQNFVASNATGAVTYAISAGALPTGLTLSAAGALTGSPIVSGGFGFSVRATDVNGCTVTTAYTLGVSCPTITLSADNLPDGNAGVVYPVQNITQVGGIGTVTFAISLGALPAGLTLSTAGVLSGTPTVTGGFDFTVRATDSNGCTGTQAYSIFIFCNTIVFSPAAGVLPAANTSANYNQLITVTGTVGTRTFTIDVGSLPGGVTLSPAGLISGIPTTLGTSNFSVRVQDANGCTETVAYTLQVSCGVIALSPGTLPNANLNLSYSQQINASGGTAPRTFTVGSGSLPTGLTLSTTGLLSGIPTVVDNYSFVVTVTDANQCTATQTYSVSVLPCTPITVNPATIAPAVLGGFYSQAFTQTGAVGTATFSLTGTLPGGLVFANGLLSGTPTTSGTFNVTVNVVDSRGCIGTRTYQLVIERVVFSQSDQHPGSILVYNFYSSSVSVPTENTRINLTNTNQNQGTFVHLFYVEGISCSVSDAYVCLTANQTTSFLMSDFDPGTQGYLVAIAVDSRGCPTNFNHLIGDEYVKLASGHSSSLGAEAISALADVPSVCDDLSFLATLRFNGLDYSALPRVLALDNIPSRADGNSTLLVVNRIGGDMTISGQFIGSLFGLLYDDAERPHSFNIPGSACQFRGILSNNLPRTSPRFEQVIPAGSSGWMKFWSQSDAALLGSSINFNPNVLTSAGAFSQGHNLHKLRLTNSASLTIPIFPPGC